MKNETSFTLKNNKSYNALLVEPGYKTKYPSLALLKFSTYLKKKKYRVAYTKGGKISKGNFDEILITTLFTTDWEYAVDSLRFYIDSYPNAHISIGGIYASLMPEHIYKKTGIFPFIGCIKEIDESPPDYSLAPSSIYGKTSWIITTRGCGRNCKFCGTRILEPEPIIISNWKKHLRKGCDLSIIHDNNILKLGDEHFFDVIDYFKTNKIKYIFDNGFDCRLFEKNHANLLKKTPITEIRFAFDTIKQDGYIQNSIKHCIKAGIPPSKIKVYILYNYNDDVDDALYRAKEVHRLGAKPYAMRYKPIRWLNRKKPYISKNWDLDELKNFNTYVNRYFIMKHWSYDDWKQKKSNILKYIEKDKIKRMKDETKEWEKKIDYLIFAGLEAARENNDNESIYNNREFIEALFKK